MFFFLNAKTLQMAAIKTHVTFPGLVYVCKAYVVVFMVLIISCSYPRSPHYSHALNLKGNMHDAFQKQRHLQFTASITTTLNVNKCVTAIFWAAAVIKMES